MQTRIQANEDRFVWSNICCNSSFHIQKKKKKKSGVSSQYISKGDVCFLKIKVRPLCTFHGIVFLTLSL